MDISTSIVADFAVILIIAALVVFLFYRLKQPMILGYLIAGVIIGPYTPPFVLVRNTNVIGAAADLGVILLLFGIGLKFPLHKLVRVGKVSFGVAAIEIAFMILLSFGFGWLLKWPVMDSVFLGTALASSSTAIIAKVLADMGKLKETPALIMLGVLVVEDMIVVALLAVISTFVDTGSITIASLAEVGLKSAAFVLGSLIIGLLVVPRLIDRIVRFSNREVLLLVVLGFCFGLSIVSNLLGLSMAVGAFLMGVIIAGSKHADNISDLISPIKDMFAAIFFVSIGALIDVTQFDVFIYPALALTAFMIITKMIGCGVGTRAFGFDNSTAIKVGLGMSQIGEFAFIVMKVGQDLNVISPFLFPIVGVAAAITTFLTPYMIKASYNLNLEKLNARPERT